jgi:hypothetical protein
MRVADDASGTVKQKHGSPLEKYGKINDLLSLIFGQRDKQERAYERVAM